MLSGAAHHVLLDWVLGEGLSAVLLPDAAPAGVLLNFDLVFNYGPGMGRESDNTIFSYSTTWTDVGFYD